MNPGGLTAFEHLFGQMLENMTDGVFLVGYDGHIRMENNVASQILDLGEENLSGKTIVDLISENSKNDAFFECITFAVFKKQKVNEIVPFYREDGERLLRLSVSPLRDREENIAALVTFSDVTELTELGRKNEALNKKLLEFVYNFIKVLIGAIDKRSHFNATHTMKMVNYTTKYLDYLEEKGKGLEPEHREALLASVWMHDVGKLVIPVGILEKPNRLAEKMETVRFRAQMAAMYEKLEMAESAQKRITELENAIRYIEDVNERGFIDDETNKRIHEIAKIPCRTYDGSVIDLLDEYDVEALTVQKGNLTSGERQVVMSHATETYNILSGMGFEGTFEKVPEWASGHHEYLDGSGYPKGISGDEISWESRLLTIIDIYDALTAEDRPYKPPIPAERAFEILRGMVEEGKLDGDILEDFYISNAWKK